MRLKLAIRMSKPGWYVVAIDIDTDPDGPALGFADDAAAVAPAMTAASARIAPPLPSLLTSVPPSGSTALVCGVRAARLSHATRAMSRQAGRVEVGSQLTGGGCP